MLKLAVLHNKVMNTAVQMSFYRTPHYKTQANFCRQSIQEALVKYSLSYSEAILQPSFPFPNLLINFPNFLAATKLPGELGNNFNRRGISIAIQLQLVSKWWNAKGKRFPQLTFKICLLTLTMTMAQQYNCCIGVQVQIQSAPLQQDHIKTLEIERNILLRCRYPIYITLFHGGYVMIFVVCCEAEGCM